MSSSQKAQDVVQPYHHGDLKNALIRAGVQILASEGVSGLSLRKVARKAGVSHAAPYAHFADKQALIAAISTEGHVRVHEVISQIMARFPGDPLRQLVETACAYLEFGMEEPDLFRITFSGVVEHERDYPALVGITHKNFEMLRELAEHCQAAGILAPGDSRLLAVSIWGSVHGLISLLQQGQVSSAILQQRTPHDLLFFTLNQITLVEIDLKDFLSNP